jgi:hypothetical protein
LHVYYPTGQSNAIKPEKSRNIDVADHKVGGAKLKVGGAAAPPFVGIGNSTHDLYTHVSYLHTIPTL